MHDFIELKMFCKVKNTINKVKVNQWEKKKVFANCVSQKGLLSKLYKELIKFKNKKTTQFKNGPKKF